MDIEHRPSGEGNTGEPNPETGWDNPPQTGNVPPETERPNAASGSPQPGASHGPENDPYRNENSRQGGQSGPSPNGNVYPGQNGAGPNGGPSPYGNRTAGPGGGPYPNYNGHPYPNGGAGGPYPNGPSNPYGYMQSKEPGSGLSTAAMILGIAAIASAVMMTVYLPFILGSLSIILGLLSRGRKPKLQGAAKTGVVCSIVGICLNLLIIGGSFFLVFSNPEAKKQFESTYERLYEETYEDMLKRLEGY